MQQSLPWISLQFAAVSPCRPRRGERRRETAVAGALEFIAFVSFVGTCIGLIAELS